MSLDSRSERTEAGYSSATELRCENVRLREKLSRAEKQAAQCSIMLHEADHRIKNSLQIVASLMSMQARNARDGQARATLCAAAAKIHAVARMHDALQQRSKEDAVNLGALLEGMGESFKEMCGEAGTVTVQITAEPVLAPGTIAQPIALAVNELVINALRHGFPNGRKGSVMVMLLRTDHALRIIVADDGVGLPKDYVGGSSYGMKLVHMIARQIGANLHVDRIRGARYSMVVPGAFALAEEAANTAARATG